MILDLNGEEAQEFFGGALAAACTEGCVIYLDGELGAGKTTLVRGFLRSLGYSGAVKSPTYTLLEPYEINQRHYYHFDLYRLADPGELEYLGIRDMLDSESILLVEWPERGKGEFPQADLVIRIRYHGEGRQLELASQSDKGGRVIELLNEELH